MACSWPARAQVFAVHARFWKKLHAYAHLGVHGVWWEGGFEDWDHCGPNDSEGIFLVIQSRLKIPAQAIWEKVTKPCPPQGASAAGDGRRRRFRRLAGWWQGS
jgi:Family of unknown function (DUF6492)